MLLFYYDQLSGPDRAAYRTLRDALGRRAAECRLYDLALTGERIVELVTMLLLDHPDFYWTKGDIRVFRDEAASPPCLRVRFQYLFPPEALPAADAAVEAGLADCCSFIDRQGGGTAEDILLGLWNWMLQNVSYGYGGDMDQSIFSVFVTRQSVCMGISRAASLVLRLYGIDSIVTLGALFGGDPHSWLLVRLGERYHHLDIALSYPRFDTMWRSYRSGGERHCFLKDDAFIAGTHRLDGRYHYPACGGEA